MFHWDLEGRSSGWGTVLPAATLLSWRVLIMLGPDPEAMRDLESEGVASLPHPRPSPVRKGDHWSWMVLQMLEDAA